MIFFFIISIATNASNDNRNTIDITTDRNLYLVPGESNVSNEQRVVTGVERSPESNAPAPPPQIASGQREIELDGENLEDQQQEQQQQHQQQHQQQQLQQPPLLTANSRDEPPLEGAVASNEHSPPTVDESQDVQHHHHHHVQHHHHHSMKSKVPSNASTGNDESDPLPEHQHHHHAARYTGAGSNKSRKHSISELERNLPERQQRRDKQRSSADRYESDDLEESEPYSSDREREREHERDRRRGYREGSVRSDREREERDYAKDKRRRAGERADKRDERDKLRDKYYARDSGKSDTLRRSGRHNRHYEDDMEDVSARRKEQPRRNGARHHNDERSGRSDRSERDYDDYNRRPRGAPKRSDKIHDDGRDGRRSNYVDDERREQRRTRRDRGGDYDTIERRHRGGGDKSMRGERVERGDLREYEEYRKQSSRNARESDLEKERARYDPRHAAMYGYPPGAYGYDPYASYYYEQMARTNPQAYSEWYKKYYGHAAAATASSLSAHAAASGDHASLNSSSLAAATADGRESVHSGRSSVQNDNDR